MSICLLFFFFKHFVVPLFSLLNPLRARLEELRMFLENETWELCPVKSNFNISQLHVSEKPATGVERAATFVHYTTQPLFPQPPPL